MSTVVAYAPNIVYFWPISYYSWVLICIFLFDFLHDFFFSFADWRCCSIWTWNLDTGRSQFYEWIARNKSICWNCLCFNRNIGHRLFGIIFRLFWCCKRSQMFDSIREFISCFILLAKFYVTLIELFFIFSTFWSYSWFLLSFWSVAFWDLFFVEKSFKRCASKCTRRYVCMVIIVQWPLHGMKHKFDWNVAASNRIMIGKVQFQNHVVKKHMVDNENHVSMHQRHILCM